MTTSKERRKREREKGIVNEKIELLFARFIKFKHAHTHTRSEKNEEKDQRVKRVRRERGANDK